MGLVDVERLGEHFDYDDELFEQLVQTFSDIYKGQIQELKTGIAQKDFELFERVAHSIKGGVSNFHADSIKDLAYELEQLGSQKNFPDNVTEQVEELSNCLEKLESELKTTKLSDHKS